MLINENPSLQSAAETLYQLNMNEQLRETCDRFIRAEARENATKRQIAELTKTLADKESEIADKDAEIARLNALLVLQENANK